MKRRRLLLGVGAAALAGAGVGIGLAVSASAPRQPPPVVPTPAVVTTYTVPSTINHTCAKDVTVALESWLNGLPNGTASNPKVVNFKNHCYEVNGELYLRGYQYFTFENGKFEQKKVPAGNETNVIDKATVAPYCGSTNFKNTLHSEEESADIMWFFEGGCHLTLLNLDITGLYHRGGDGVLKVDSFITFAGTQIALVKELSANGTFGDFVDVQALHECGGCFATYPATDITINLSTGKRAGREGIGIITVKRLTIEHSTFADVAATVFDVEADCPGCTEPDGPEEDITITHDTIDNSYAYVLSAITAGTIDNLQMLDTTMPQLRFQIEPFFPATDIRVDHDTASEANTSNNGKTPSVVVTSLASVVEVDDNTVPVTHGHVLARLPTGGILCQNNGATTPACPSPSPVPAPVLATLP